MLQDGKGFLHPKHSSVIPGLAAHFMLFYLFELWRVSLLWGCSCAGLLSPGLLNLWLPPQFSLTSGIFSIVLDELEMAARKKVERKRNSG